MTTTLSNPDGYQARTADGKIMPLAEQRQALSNVGIGVNVALTNGHNALREQVMTGDLKRPANVQEIRQMQEILRRGMAEEGSFGLSLGVEYFSARYADLNEEVELARVAAEYNGIFIPHLRSQGISPMWYRPSADGNSPPTLDDSINETLAVAEQNQRDRRVHTYEGMGAGLSRPGAEDRRSVTGGSRPRTERVHGCVSLRQQRLGRSVRRAAGVGRSPMVSNRKKTTSNFDYTAALTAVLKQADGKRRGRRSGARRQTSDRAEGRAGERAYS